VRPAAGGTEGLAAAAVGHLLRKRAAIEPAQASPFTALALYGFPFGVVLPCTEKALSIVACCRLFQQTAPQAVGGKKICLASRASAQLLADQEES
jgi:hypothetical protein